MKKTTETKTNATETKTNAKKSNKLFSFDQCIELMKTCNIGYKNATRNYRIFNGGSSLNVKKTKFVIYTNNDDFELVKNAKIENVTLIENGNINDVKRQHIVECNDNETLKSLLMVYAKNVANQPH